MWVNFERNDNVNQSFVREVMAHVGFDEYTSSLIYTMGEGSLSQPMLNGGIAQPILILKSVNQGCSLNLFLFAILTHSIFVILYNMAIESRYSFPYHYANDALCKHHQIITLCFWSLMRKHYEGYASARIVCYIFSIED